MKAIVTGANSGIGQAIVALLKSKDWEVTELIHADLDLSDLEAVESFTRNLNQDIDALIHVAGVWHDKNKVLADKSLEQFSAQEITTTMNVGVTSFMLLSAGLLPKISKKGTVVAITGTFSEGGAGWLPYYTSKRALEDFITGLAQDYPDGPKVFGVSPADTATVAYKKFYPEYASEAQTPDVVAKVCEELITAQPHFKSGDIIVVRDGKTSQGYHS
jgi:NAD(P)-dependent dehydrogenase (short-subunit alcohol dehydrogenase family)